MIRNLNQNINVTPEKPPKASTKTNIDVRVVEEDDGDLIQIEVSNNTSVYTVFISPPSACVLIGALQAAIVELVELSPTSPHPKNKPTNNPKNKGNRSPKKR